MGHTNATNPNAEELGQILAILDQAQEMPGGGSRNFLRPCMYVVPKKIYYQKYKTTYMGRKTRPLS